MKKTILYLTLAYILFFSSCISLKKYRLLEKDYQECGQDQRSYEQMKRIEEVEKIEKERLKKEGRDE